MCFVNCVLLFFMICIFLDEIDGNCILGANKDFYQPSPVSTQDCNYTIPNIHSRNGDVVAKGSKKVQQREYCILSLNKDFGQPSPVYIQDGDYMIPSTHSKNGDVVVKGTEKILVACPGENRYLELGNNDTTDEIKGLQTLQFAEARCMYDTVFAVGTWAGQFKDIRCNAPPWFSTEETQLRCHRHHLLYKVGYKIQDKFYTLYETCFDKGNLTTLWVRHSLSPASKFLQNIGHRPQFVEGSLYPALRMSEVYKNKSQKRRFREVLGNEMDEKYITKTQFLTKGHLAPRADFPLRSQQRASFHYINASPQWMRGNAGDWAALEEGLRRRVSSYNSTLIVYTGTQDVLALPDSAGRMTEVYLSTDTNNNNVVPVPLYFYKLVYDPKEQTAIAFVMINTSYYNASTVEELTFCSSVCIGANYAWLRWRNDGTHSFCCRYDQLLSVIDAVPHLKVKGVFY